jgi:hypothetical protein
MKTMTLSIIAALAFGCASKPVEDLPTDDLPEAGSDGSSSDADADDDDDDEDSDDGDPGAADEDGDGVTVDEGDCNDDDEDVYPGADEECNGIDDDCDDRIDEGLDTQEYFEDYDEDSYGDPEVSVEACERPEGYVENDDDCDDTEDSANPDGVEVSFNDIDENCDGLDFGDAEECVDGALELTMDWMDYWTFPLPDTSGPVPIFGPLSGEYEMTDKYLNVDPIETTATAVDGDALKVTVEIETNITVQTHMTANAFGYFAQNCTMEIGPTPVLISGTVELDLDGDLITGEANLDYTVLAVSDYDADEHPDIVEGESCTIGTIDTILGYLGYSIDEFIADDLDGVAAALTEQVENDLETWDIPEACTPGDDSEETELCTNTCDWSGDGECDDGGTGSTFAICEYGTDCDDCGTRYE